MLDFVRDVFENEIQKKPVIKEPVVPRMHSAEAMIRPMSVTEVELEPSDKTAATARSDSSTARALVTLEDRQILKRFEGVDTVEWLRQLQVFWCVGHLDHEALTNGRMACGVKKLADRLEAMQNQGRIASSLHVSESFIHAALKGLARLINSPAFHDVWTADESVPSFRVGSDSKRKGAHWTPRARKAWMYVDRFLALRGDRPVLRAEPAKESSGHPEMRAPKETAG